MARSSPHLVTTVCAPSLDRGRTCGDHVHTLLRHGTHVVARWFVIRSKAKNPVRASLRVTADNIQVDSSLRSE